MIQLRKPLALMLILALLLVLPAGGFAKDGDDDDGYDDSSGRSSDDAFDDSSGRSSDDDDDAFDDSSDQGSDDFFGDSSLSSLLSGNPEYMALLAQKRDLQTRIDALKDRIDVAKDSDNDALENQLEAELRILKNQKDNVEAQMFQLTGTVRFSSFDDSKHLAESELRALKAQRDGVEAELLQLRAEASRLLASGDTAGLAALQLRIREQEALKDTLKAQIEAKRRVIKDALRHLYSDDEWNAALALQTQLNRLNAVQALPLNSVLLLGQEVKLDTPPVIISGRTLIPIRAIATALNATVFWDESEQKITITKGDRVVEFEIGDDSMKVNGRSVSLDVPAQIVNSRTVIPLRAMVESLGLSAEWDAVLQVIDIQ